MKVQSATTSITHEVTVAGGVSAPGHLGELTQYLPSQLREWALLGFFSRTGSAPMPSTRRPDQHPRQPNQTLNYAALRRMRSAIADH